MGVRAARCFLKQMRSFHPKVSFNSRIESGGKKDAPRGNFSARVHACMRITTYLAHD